MLNWDKIKEKTGQLYNNTKRKIRQYTPETFSKDKKFINALVISLVLMTMADKKVETDEVTASIDLINDIDEIKDLDMVSDAIELYEMHLENLEKLLDNNTKWTIAIAKLLSEISKIKEYPEYPPMIENLLTYIAESDGNLDPLESEMKEKILSAIK